MRIETVEYLGQRIQFAADTELTLHRADTFHSKEPGTLAWISSFEPDDIFWDVGANVGVYALAAASRGIRTFAFEPEAKNFEVLAQNAQHNGFKCLTISDIAIGNQTGIGRLHLYGGNHGYMAGQSHHSLDANYGHHGKPHKWVDSHAVSVWRLDALKLPRPDHIKIDVDGLEHRVIDGMGDIRPKSILVEINQKLREHMEMVSKLRAIGYRHEPPATRKDSELALLEVLKP